MRNAFLAFCLLASACSKGPEALTDKEAADKTATFTNANVPPAVAEKPQATEVAASEPSADRHDNSRTAIYCSNTTDSGRGIHIIDEVRQRFYDFNTETGEIDPICPDEGSCSWNHSDNKISFENAGVGFLAHGELDRAAGTMHLVSKFDQNIDSVCHKIAMPKIAANKF